VTPDLMHAVAEIREHADAYQQASDYYTGDVDEVFVSSAVRRALKGAVGGFDINLARRPVDAVLDRMRISAVQVPGDEAATRHLIDTVWTPNRMDRVSKRVHKAALTNGDAYLTVWPGEDDGTVELHYNSPKTTRVFYSEENDRVKAFAARLWSEGHGDQRIYRADLYYPDRVEQYVTGAGKTGETAGEWERFLTEDVPWPVPNPYDMVPVFHWRTGEPYGTPEHRGAFGPQNAITKLSSTLMSTIDFQGFPQRWQLMNPDNSGSADGLFGFDDDDEGAPDDSGSSLTAGPGRVWKLDAKSVGQFDPANVDAFLRPLQFYARAMAASTATPLRFFEPSGDVPSGESLRADDAPLAQRIADREELFADEWRDCLVFAMVVAGTPIPEPDIKWTPTQTVDDETGWKTVLLKLSAGVPFVQAMTEAGYLSDLVEGWPVPVPRSSDVHADGLGMTA
jgi:Phage portal protein, SPP1 Gp6-like